jgi:predicted nucleic acid-binding protein
MYAIGRDHAHKDMAMQVLKDIESEKIFAVSSCEVFQDILHRYSHIGEINTGLKLFDIFYEIVDEVLPLNFEIIKTARTILEEKGKTGISARDCIHVATMQHYNIKHIATFDMHFKKCSEISLYNPL